MLEVRSHFLTLPGDNFSKTTHFDNIKDASNIFTNTKYTEFNDVIDSSGQGVYNVSTLRANVTSTQYSGGGHLSNDADGYIQFNKDWAGSDYYKIEFNEGGAPSLNSLSRINLAGYVTTNLYLDAGLYIACSVERPTSDNDYTEIFYQNVSSGTRVDFDISLNMNGAATNGTYFFFRAYHGTNSAYSAYFRITKMELILGSINPDIEIL